MDINGYKWLSKWLYIANAVTFFCSSGFEVHVRFFLRDVAQQVDGDG